MFKLKESILLFFLAFVSTIAYAQSLTVTGKVVDSEGYEVIGGSVIIKGAAGIGTVTDIDGHYSLKVNDASKDVLVFSYVGMTPQEVKVNNQSVINVTLQADAVLLDEVVAIGYATVKRKDLTGSVASVNSKELSKVISHKPLPAAWQVCRLCRVKVLPELPFLFGFVVVFPLLKVTNLCISSTVSPAKTVCLPLTRRKLKQSTS